MPGCCAGILHCHMPAHKYESYVVNHPHHATGQPFEQLQPRPGLAELCSLAARQTCNAHDSTAPDLGAGPAVDTSTREEAEADVTAAASTAGESAAGGSKQGHTGGAASGQSSGAHPADADAGTGAGPAGGVLANGGCGHGPAATAAAAAPAEPGSSSNAFGLGICSAHTRLMLPFVAQHLHAEVAAAAAAATAGGEDEGAGQEPGPEQVFEVVLGKQDAHPSDKFKGKLRTEQLAARMAPNFA